MKKLFPLVVAGILGGLIVLTGNYFFQKNQADHADQNLRAKAVNNLNVGAGNVNVPFDFTQAAELAMPAVVHISSIQKPQTTSRTPPNDPFRLFFGDNWSFGNPIPKGGTGSGVIYSPDGYIITNNHVVDFADEVEVTLNDNRKFKAKVVGTYPKADLAVIKIDGKDLSTLQIADSDRAKVGQWVLAVGNPFELTSTVTAGIISATGRDINIIQGRDAIEAFIQTDAAVNPGNSGGALVDAQGRLLGINTAISTQTGVFEGYSFAIPINIVTRIADDLIKKGSYERPYLGVNISELDNDYANDLGIKETQGVVIEELVDGGSAQFAGVLPKDVIVAVNGKIIKNVPELQEIVGRSNVGDTLNLTVIRKGKRQDIPVRLKAG